MKLGEKSDGSTFGRMVSESREILQRQTKGGGGGREGEREKDYLHEFSC